MGERERGEIEQAHPESARKVGSAIGVEQVRGTEDEQGEDRGRDRREVAERASPGDGDGGREGDESDDPADDEAADGEHECSVLDSGVKQSL